MRQSLLQQSSLSLIEISNDRANDLPALCGFLFASFGSYGSAPFLCVKICMVQERRSLDYRIADSSNSKRRSMQTGNTSPILHCT